MHFCFLTFSIALVGSFLALALLIALIAGFGIAGGGSAQENRSRNITVLVVAVAILLIGPYWISGASALIGSATGMALLCFWLVPRLFKRRPRR